MPIRNLQTSEFAGGLFGSLISLRSYVEKFEPDKVIIVTDGHGGSLRRRRIYENYKSSRRVPRRICRSYDFDSIEDEKSSMRRQFIRLVEYIKILPVNFVNIDYIEADDGIAYIVSSLKKENDHFIIISSDKDFLQLINEQCSVYRPIMKILYDEQKFIDDFNLNSKNYAIVKALVGDVSDNILGLKGMGIKTAVKAFPFLQDNKFHNIDSLFTFCQEQIDNENAKNKWYQIVLDNQEDIELNYRLVQLHDVDIGLAIKTQISEIYNRIPPMISPFSIRKMFITDTMFSQIKIFERWTTTFARLARKSQQKEKGVI